MLLSQRLKSVEPLERRLAMHPHVLERLRARAAKHHVDLIKLRYESLLFIADHVNKAGPTGPDEPTVQGLDHYVRARCKDRATVEYLETPDENIIHLVNLPASAQIEQLAEDLLEMTPQKEVEAREAGRVISVSSPDKSRGITASIRSGCLRKAG